MRRPQLLTPTELSRLRDRSDENDKLATCWDCEHVGILLFDYSAPPVSYTGYPMLRVSLLKRAVSKMRHASGWCESEREFTFIGNVTNAPPRDYHYGKSSTYEQPAALMRDKVEEILAELSDRYATLCLCTARPKQLALGLQKIGLTIPKQFVVVDLVRVLEFQAVPDVINRVLAGQEGFAARANDGEIWTGPGHGADCSLASVLLALVGPLAKNYTGDWKRIEREAVAASRLLGGTGLKVVGEMNKIKSRSSKRGKREPDT